MDVPSCRRPPSRLVALFRRPETYMPVEWPEDLAVKWWFPGRLFGLPHKGPKHSPEWKREHDVTT